MNEPTNDEIAVIAGAWLFGFVCAIYLVYLCGGFDGCAS